MSEEIMTVSELCREYKVSPSWAYKRIATGEIPTISIPGGRLKRIRRSTLDKVFGLTTETPEQSGK
jgi:excisionase family DNA binding protein